MSGRKRYIVLPRTEVVIANKSHINRSFGIGNIQYVNQTRPRCMKILEPAWIRPKVVINSAARVNGRRNSAFITRRIAEINVPAWLIPIQNTVFTRKTPQYDGRITPATPNPLAIIYPQA